jgi:hypothetical protein
MKNLLVILLAVGTVFAVCTVDAQTFRQALTIANTAGSYEVAPVYNTVATGQRIEAVVFNFASVTVTVNAVVGNTTNQVGTKIVTATDKIWFAGTNAPSLFRGDRLLFTAGVTTTSAFNYVIGTEF